MAALYGGPAMGKLIQTVRFSRPIDKEKDCISPGGYEVTFGTCSPIQFDFCDYEGYIDKDDPSVVYMEQYTLDTESFPEAAGITEEMMQDVQSVQEWYIYTGEDGGQEDMLRPVEVLSASLYTPDGRKFPIDVKKITLE